MEIRQLEIFLAVVDLGTFTRAAEQLMIAQPAVSQAIKTMEDRLGLVLMQRSRAGVVLTAAGQALLESARIVLAESENGERRAKLASIGLTGSLRIGFLGSATAPFLPDLIQEFRRRFPEVAIELYELTPRQQLEAFVQGRIDVGCNRPLPEAMRAALASHPVYTDRLVVVVPDSDPLAARSSLALEELKDPDLVLFQAAQAPELMYEVRRRLLDIPHRVVGEAGLMPTVLLMVASGLGISIVPACVKHLRQPGVSFLEIEGPRSQISLEISYRKEQINPAVGHWVHLVQERRTWIRELMES